MKGFDGCRILLADDDEISREIAESSSHEYSASAPLGCTSAREPASESGQNAKAAAPATNNTATAIAAAMSLSLPIRTSLLPRPISRFACKYNFIPHFSTKNLRRFLLVVTKALSPN